MTIANPARPRQAAIHRTTAETDIALELFLDGQGRREVTSGVPFLDHMLTLFTVHGFFDFRLQAKGDVEIDDHHTVEDIGICLGQALAQALGDKGGIERYACVHLPMDEALVRVVMDISNRPFLHWQVTIPDQKTGNFDTTLAKEFIRAFSQHGGLTLHVDLLHGDNSHHIIEAVFKGLGRCLREATRPLDGAGGVLSSKGSL